MVEELLRRLEAMDEDSWLRVISEILDKDEDERELHEVVLLNVFVEVGFGI